MLAKQITLGKIVRVLTIGFAAVIVLLVAAGLTGVKNASLIQENAEALLQNQLVTTRLIEGVQREQDTLNATFYKLSAGAAQIDRDRVLTQLDEADRNIDRLVMETERRPEERLWRDLVVAMRNFSTEARRVLAFKNVPNYSTRDLFRRHEEVVATVAKVIAAGYNRMVSAQQQVQLRSQRLARESFLLLGGCLLLALVSSILTLRIASDLLRRMEWQSGELNRVTWHMLESQETTARRFSHELHDELGQSLTAIKANVLALGPAWKGHTSRLDDCLQVVDDAIQNVRELSQLLRPTILDDFGLDASLRWLTERFTQRTGIDCMYNSTFHARLPDEIETHVFRIVQEALTNVARHSGATRVTVELDKDREGIRLSLVDNGRGLPSGNGREAGMGLIGMRARARSAGGELKVGSPKSGGVSINLWAPAGDGETVHS